MQSSINTSQESKQSNSTVHKNRSQRDFMTFGRYLMKLLKSIFFVVVFISLTFHWMPDRGHIFPKERLSSFANTIISEEDIENLIARHNEAGGIERALIHQDYLYKKMQELGVIFEKIDEE